MPYFSSPIVPHDDVDKQVTAMIEQSCLGITRIHSPKPWSSQMTNPKIGSHRQDSTNQTSNIDQPQVNCTPHASVSRQDSARS